MPVRRSLLRGLTGALALATVLGVAGCNSGGADSNSPTATAGTSGVQIEIANTINFGSFGTTATIDCASGKSLSVGGSNNVLTVRGTCAGVNIGGADNKITFDKVDGNIVVVGLNNSVTYRDGEPSVSDTGTGNTVKKG